MPKHKLKPRIILIRSFFPRSLARLFLARLRALPLITTPPPRTARERAALAARVNDRLQLHDPAFSRRLWAETGLREVLVGEAADDDLRALWGGTVVGLNPNIRIYRYSKGQFFDRHYDESNNVAIPSDASIPLDVADPSNAPTGRSGAAISSTIAPAQSIPAKTTWTLLLYLTSEPDGCIGGETVFYPSDNPFLGDAIVVPPETGMLLLHKHGEDCMLHESRVVTEGEKWVIRTDLCVINKS